MISDSSSSSEQLKKHQDNMKEVSLYGYSNNSLLDSLHNNVSELLRYKEDYLVLESQLRISKETSKLQEAEFAFQISEYENQIVALKNSEAELKEVLSRLQQGKVKGKNEYEVQVKLNREGENGEEIYRKKYLKWKKRAKNSTMEQQTVDKSRVSASRLEKQGSDRQKDASKTKSQLWDENRSTFSEIDVSRQNSMANSERKENKRSKESLLGGNTNNSAFQDENSNSALVVDLKNEIYTKNKVENELRSRIRDLESDLDNKQAEGRKNQSRIAELERMVESQQDLTQNQQKEISTLEAKLIRASNEVETMRNRLQNMSLSSNAAKDLQNAESELQNLCKLLEIPGDDVSSQWTGVFHKVQALISNSKEIELIRAENNKIRRQLSNLMDQMSSSRINDTDLTKSENKRLQKQLDVLLYQKYAFRSISNAFNSIQEDVTDLFYSITSQDRPLMRPLILTVMILKRMQRPSVMTSQAENRFGSNASPSTSTMLKTIKNTVLSMSNTILDLKTSIRSVERERDELKQKVKENGIEKALQERKYEERKSKLKVLKKRMLELQEELSTLVELDDYQAAQRRVSSYENKVKNLNKALMEAEITYEEQRKQISSLSSDLISAKNKAELRQKKLESMENHLEAMKAEMERISPLIEAKDREIERLQDVVKKCTVPGESALVSFHILNDDSDAEENSHTEDKPVLTIKVNHPPGAGFADSPKVVYLPLNKE